MEFYPLKSIVEKSVDVSNGKNHGIVTQKYVSILQVLVKYVLRTYILLVNQSLILRGLLHAVSHIHVSYYPFNYCVANSIRLTERILLPSTQAMYSGQFALSDTMDEWIARQNILIKVIRDKQLLMIWSNSTQLSLSIRSFPTFSSHLLFREATSSFPVKEDLFKY